MFIFSFLKYFCIVTDQFSGQPQEGFLEVVVRLGGDVVVLEVLLPVEHDGLGLHLPVLDVDLVSGQHDGDVLADSDQVPVPVGDVLVGDSAGHVEHDDGALALDVVSISQSSELLLASSVPDVEPDGASVGVEHQGMNLGTCWIN